MAILEIRSIEDVFHVMLENGETIPIRRADGPVRTFNPGWRPVSVVTCFAPLHLLTLSHVDGHEATWFLDETMLHIGSVLQHVLEAHGAVLRERALEMYLSLLVGVVMPARPERVPAAEDLTALCPAMLREIGHLVLPGLAAGITFVDLSAPGADAMLEEAGLQPARVRATLAGSVTEAYRRLLREGALTCASPFDDVTCEAGIGLMLLDRLTAYRFADSPGRQCFYVLTQDYHAAKTGLYLPGHGLYCVAGPAPTIGILFEVLLNHVASHQRRLIDYLATPARSKRTIGFVSDYPTLHIGHVIWNELSGLEELVQMLEPVELPDLCVLNSENGTEVFGPLDTLFPEFAGRVIRPDVGWAGAAAWVYESRLFFIRYMTKYVRAAVGERVRGEVDRDPRLAGDRALAGRFGRDGRPCILFGLRVGNRTMADQAGFLIAATEHLLARLGRIAIVLDGFSSRLALDPTTSYASFGPPGQEEPLVEELRLVFAVRRHFHGRSVEIVSTVGAPIACSLFWIMQSRFFVAPWGAALAKYRWICNMPGFVMTNRYNIANPGDDLGIYHAPEFVEAPTPMRFIDLDHVADAPGPAGFYANFVPDPAAVRNALDLQIAEAGLVPATA